MEKKDIARIFVTQCKENKMYKAPDGKVFMSQNLCECYCKEAGLKEMDIVELNRADYAIEIAEIENPVRPVVESPVVESPVVVAKK